MSNSSQNGQTVPVDIAGHFAVPKMEEWLALVEKQLGEHTYRKRLCRTTKDGVELKPLYTRHDTDLLDTESARFHRPSRWQMTQTLRAADGKQLQTALSSSSVRTLDAVTVRTASFGASADYKLGFSEFDAASTALHLEAGVTPAQTMAMLADVFRNRKLPASSLKGTLLADPAAELLIHGSLPSSWESVVEETVSCILSASDRQAGFRCLGIDARPCLEASGTIVQQLAYAASQLIQLLRDLHSLGTAPAAALPHVHVHFGVGSEVFPEIAKLRAFRSLWRQIVQTLDSAENAEDLCLFAHCSEWTKSRLDPHTNLLRTTTEAMSAVLGGADWIDTLPFDYCSGSSNDFSMRLAGNIQLILREEAHLDRVSDAAGGSYYIEYLTDYYSRTAWNTVQEIEAAGGMREALNQGTIQTALSKARQDSEEAVARRKPAIVGTSMYINPEEITQAEPQAGSQSVDTRRRSSGYEQLREKTAAYRNAKGSSPSAAVVCVGPLVEYAARLDFTKAFLEPGGFDVRSHVGIESADAAADCAVQDGAEVIVLCAANEKYPQLIPALSPKIRAACPHAVVLMAGYLKEHAEEFENSGIDDCIQLGANHLYFLEKLLDRLGGAA